MAVCRILLADDHAIFRAGLKSLIDQDPAFKVVGQAKDGQDLLTKLASLKCDLVVLDISMPNISGLSALKQIRTQFPAVKILILTMQKDLEHFKRAMEGGAAGYLLKADAYEQLSLAVKTVMKGKTFVAPSVAELLTARYIRSLDGSDEPVLDILTKRERQVLKLIAGGASNKAAAAKLKISVRTVEAHRGNLMNKLGIKNTAGLVRYAAAQGLI